MKKLYTLSLALLAGALSYGQAFTATYDFAAITASSTQGLTDPTPVPTAAGATFGSFRVVNPNLAPTVTGSSGAGRFSFANQPLGATASNDSYAALTGSLNTAVYYEVVVTPAAGQALNFSSITFRAQRSGTGVRTFAVRSSVDGFAANLPASVAPPVAPAIQNVNVQDGNVFFWILDSFTQGTNGQTISLNYTNIGAPVTFRFYGYNAEGDGGNFSIDDVVFSGSTSTLGTKDNAISGLKVYPNPVKNGNLFISSDSNNTKSVAVYDVLGKQVINTTVSNSPINVSNLQGGVYIVKITEAGKTATRKLVIE